MKKNNSNNYHVKNLGLEFVNILVFLIAALKLWDKRMRKIVWATFTRQIEVSIFKEKTIKYVEEHRKGNCNNCGVCCQYIRKCPFLTSENKCTVNGEKHFICKIYPISNYDVQLVSKVFNKKCGYYFDYEKE